MWLLIIVEAKDRVMWLLIIVEAKDRMQLAVLVSVETKDFM